jgi:hypothetical protein
LHDLLSTALPLLLHLQASVASLEAISVVFVVS